MDFPPRVSELVYLKMRGLQDAFLEAAELYALIHNFGDEKTVELICYKPSHIQVVNGMLSNDKENTVSDMANRIEGLMPDSADVDMESLVNDNFSKGQGVLNIHPDLNDGAITIVIMARNCSF